MDALALTLISTLALAVLVPIDWYVAWRYYRAWDGGESIPYFAPTMALVAGIAVTATGTLLVALSALALRAFGQQVLPPGVGLVVITAVVFVPSAPMPWFLHLLRGKR